jgi:parvulin-like peptidyl-prolyl isomerase
MDIVAQVFDWKITKTELEFEENKLRNKFIEADSAEIRAFAITQLIDRFLLMQEAINNGIKLDDEEFEDALFMLLDDIETPEASVLVNRSDRGEQIERMLKSDLIIQKYLNSIEANSKEYSDEKLHQFYLDRIEFFCKETEVRASHILIKGNDDEALKRINKIRDCIFTPEDFASVSLINSECPSGVNCGDLGFFPKGRMDSEIDKVAFSLGVNEISPPFKTKHGYHILMVTDKKEKQAIPFEQIKDCLKESLKEIEEEITVARILNDAREKSKNSITIFDHAFQ